MNTPIDQGLVFDPILPAPLIALIGGLTLALTVYSGWRVGSAIERGQALILLLFRISGIALVVLLLLQPSRRKSLPPLNKERVTVVGVDSSASMKQRDVGNAARLDAAKNLLQEANVVSSAGLVENPRLNLYEFGTDARPVSGSILDLQPSGASTRLHQSVETMLNGSSSRVVVNALVLLSDGHDHELINPVKTGASARARHIPIYAVALGKQGKVRDVSARITSYQPYCYVKQKARVTAALRLIGCEFETLSV